MGSVLRSYWALELLKGPSSVAFIGWLRVLCSFGCGLILFGLLGILLGWRGFWSCWLVFVLLIVGSVLWCGLSLFIHWLLTGRNLILIGVIALWRLLGWLVCLRFSGLRWTHICS